MQVTLNFLVCVLCLQALVVPPSVKLSAFFLTSGIRWRGSRAGTIRPIDQGEREDIKGVCHTHRPVHLCFYSKLYLGKLTMRFITNAILLSYTSNYKFLEFPITVLACQWLTLECVKVKHTPPKLSQPEEYFDVSTFVEAK